MRRILYGVLMVSLAFNLSGWDSKLANEIIQKNPIVKTVHLTKKTQKVVNTPEKVTVTELKLTVGKETFNVQLYENKTSQALIELLPMTVDMGEMNGNEKYYYLSKKLPIALEQPSDIHAGDLMLYGSDCLVLFYENFSSAYQYTRIGSIEDADGLAQALGNKNCSVTIDIVKNNKDKDKEKSNE